MVAESVEPPSGVSRLIRRSDYYLSSMPQHRSRPDRYLTERLSFVLADDEKQAIRQAAAANGQSVSTFIRLSTLGTAVAPPAHQSQILTAGAETFQT